MSLDIYLMTSRTCPNCGHTLSSGHELFHANITHNLVPMWQEAGVYEALYKSAGKRAKEIALKLEAAICSMMSDPPRFEQHNSPNGWGLYQHALPWLRRLHAACLDDPESVIEVSA